MGVIRHFGPVPQYRRMMIFVDGENLVFRYQDMLSKGFIPHVHNSYEKDIFVWNQNSLVNLQKQHEILRATYYTYASGDDERLYDIKQKLKSLSFIKDGQSVLPEYLYPQVFTKLKRHASGKGVDIQLTVDILTHALQNNLETVFLLSGDGDYKPVIETVMQNGKQVFLAAFSSGLNPTLPHIVDKFVSLDNMYFEKDPNGNPVT